MYKLTIHKNNQKADEITITHDVLRIGRKSDNDIRLDDYTVSSHHALIRCNEMKAVLEDCKSTNGTYLNGKLINQQSLQDGDVIMLGKISLLFKDLLQDEDSEEIDPTRTISKMEMDHLLIRIQQGKGGQPRPSGTVSSRKLNWIAQNENGTWWGFEQEPQISENGWVVGVDSMKILLKEEPANQNWSETLQKL